ncbi:uncharacterized protein LOC119469763 [Cebus imitator]|uniref:uncharacterized protein LOC119469763 n=1 Tax=Cebus imitator TaxID=2715852 RepID=UPI00189B24ED|nr:uncharacterized protein LOC119469763 [Cebus imitator]
MLRGDSLAVSGRLGDLELKLVASLTERDGSGTRKSKETQLKKAECGRDLPGTQRCGPPGRPGPEHRLRRSLPARLQPPRALHAGTPAHCASCRPAPPCFYQTLHPRSAPHWPTQPRSPGTPEPQTHWRTCSSKGRLGRKSDPAYSPEERKLVEIGPCPRSPESRTRVPRQHGKQVAFSKYVTATTDAARLLGRVATRWSYSATLHRVPGLLTPPEAAALQGPPAVLHCRRSFILPPPTHFLPSSHDGPSRLCLIQP